MNVWESLALMLFSFGLAWLVAAVEVRRLRKKRLMIEDGEAQRIALGRAGDSGSSHEHPVPVELR